MKKAFKNRKSQIDVDLLFSYMLFITFIIFLVYYVLGLMNPFKDSINFHLQERRALLMQSFIKTEKLSYKTYDSICNNSFDFLTDMKVQYTILGFALPAVDSSLPSSYDILIKRESNLINISACSDSNINYIIHLTFPKDSIIYAVMESTESSDSITESEDEYLNKIETISFNLNSTDCDSLIINPGNKKMLITISFENVNLSNSYIGDIPIKHECGTEGSSSRHFYTEKYGTLSDKNFIYPIKAGIDGWY